MLLGPLILLTFSIAIEAGPFRADADADAPDRSPESRAASLVRGVLRQEGGIPFVLLSQPEQASPWDDEIEFPDDSEDEEPEDPGEALNPNPPPRGHAKACLGSRPIGLVVGRSALTIAPSPHFAGPWPSPAALCRLLF
jgi:hypothetical protein